MLEIIRNHPYGVVGASILIIVLCLLAFVIGWVVLGWLIRGATWVIPKLDAIALEALRLFR